MKYERNFGLVSRKMKNKIAGFHVLELFMAKNMILTKKNFPLSRAVVRENLGHAYNRPLKS
jgi:hypothetical protein